MAAPGPGQYDVQITLLKNSFNRMTRSEANGAVVNSPEKVIHLKPVNFF